MRELRLTCQDCFSDFMSLTANHPDNTAGMVTLQAGNSGILGDIYIAITPAQARRAAQWFLDAAAEIESGDSGIQAPEIV